jgi:hypothetical protein
MAYNEFNEESCKGLAKAAWRGQSFIVHLEVEVVGNHIGCRAHRALSIEKSSAFRWTAGKPDHAQIIILLTAQGLDCWY